MLLLHPTSSSERHFLLTILVVCSHFSFIKACTSGSIYLVGGTKSSEGTVQVCRNGAYGTVCDDSWGDTDAKVVCRQLGYSSGTAYTNAYFGRGTGSIVMDDVRCTGSESKLIDCPHTTDHNCIHSEDAGVRCEGLHVSVGAIVGGVIGGIVFLICVCACCVCGCCVCAYVLLSKSNRSRARARQAPAIHMTSIPAQTTSTTTGAYTQSQPKSENQPPPPSYSDYMEQQKQPTAPMAYPGHAESAGYPAQGYSYPVQGYPGYGYPTQGYPAPPPQQQDYSQAGYPQQVPYPQQQQQEAPVGYPQQKPKEYGGTNPATDESTGICDELPPPY